MKIAAIIFSLSIVFSLSATAQSVIIFTTKSKSSPSGNVTVREWHADIDDLTIGPKWDGVGIPPFDESKLQEIARRWCSSIYPGAIIGDLKIQRKQRAESVDEGYGWFYIYYFEVARSATTRPGWIAPPADPIVILSSGKPVMGLLKINEPNQALQTTPPAVTPRADARVAPAAVMSDPKR